MEGVGGNQEAYTILCLCECTLSVTKNRTDGGCCFINPVFSEHLPPREALNVTVPSPDQITQGGREEASLPQVKNDLRPKGGLR